MSVHRCSTCASIASLREYTCITRVWVASNECDVHSFAAHCLRFCLFTAAHAARPSLQYICPSISSLRGCTRVDGFGFRGKAQLVKITGQMNNMKKTVLVQNEALEWGTTCFPTRAFRLIFGTNTVGSLYKIELVLVPGRLLWYRTKMCPIRNVTQQGALARNCPSKASWYKMKL